MQIRNPPLIEESAINPILERLARRVPVTALGIRMARTGEIARLARASGHDAIWVDLEHSSMSVDIAVQICATALDVGLVPLVRVPEREYGVVGRLLDGGAMGVIAPRIETAEQAADIVAASRFPPDGHRSAIATLPLIEYRRLPAQDVYGISNRLTLVKVLIESPIGIENIEAIAKVPGVDLVGIGSNDLSAELGVPGDYRHAKMQHALEVALSACRKVGKPLAIGGIADASLFVELIGKGAAPFLMTGIDTDLFLGVAQERVKQVLAMLG
jgi:2-keto-3-deoxy-L-rhamnonate aldolase RhmA